MKLLKNAFNTLVRTIGLILTIYRRFNGLNGLIESLDVRLSMIEEALGQDVYKSEKGQKVRFLNVIRWTATGSLLGINVQHGEGSNLHITSNWATKNGEYKREVDDRLFLLEQLLEIHRVGTKSATVQFESRALKRADAVYNDWDKINGEFERHDWLIAQALLLLGIPYNTANHVFEENDPSLKLKSSVLAQLAKSCMNAEESILRLDEILEVQHDSTQEPPRFDSMRIRGILASQKELILDAERHEGWIRAFENDWTKIVLQGLGYMGDDADDKAILDAVNRIRSLERNIFPDEGLSVPASLADVRNRFSEHAQRLATVIGTLQNDVEDLKDGVHMGFEVGSERGLKVAHDGSLESDESTWGGNRTPEVDTKLQFVKIVAELESILPKLIEMGSRIKDELLKKGGSGE
jgi:hypothetical protein